VARTSERNTWLGSDRLLARVVGRPVARFLDVEAAGGVALLTATAVALVWANSPWSDSYEQLWTTDLVINLGDSAIHEDLRHWVNDGLMALFFFVVGLEIKRELVAGHLSTRRDATLPVLAAVGGMVVPALIYAAVNLGGDGSSGWGIPMATDIAFAVGVLALVGDRCPHSMRAFLLALAIADDIGAIVVIALFYSDGVSLVPLGLAVLGLLAIVLLRRATVWYAPVYLIVGFAVWLAVFESGVHATLAGVALGLLTPARPLMSDIDADRVAAELSTDSQVEAEEVRDIAFRIQESVSVAERLERALHPWTSYFVIPLFALANAGVVLSSDTLRDAVSSPVTAGVAVGLVVGKVLGVVGASALAVRIGLARLPEGVAWRHLTGVAALAGIGFTVSIFITGLAFDDAALQQEAKLGVLAASAVAAGLGAMLLWRADRRPDTDVR
jgi:NhaA family Na+:H+ antiporter